MGGGTVMSAMEQKKAGEDEYKLRKANAELIRGQSEAAARAEGEKAGLKRAEKARLAARQNVLFAKAGVSAGVGTPLLVREDSLERIEQQAQILQERGFYEREFGRQAAGIEIARGKAAKRAGRLRAGATLATGFGSMFLMLGAGGGGAGGSGSSASTGSGAYGGTMGGGPTGGYSRSMIG
jgi:hypothetical protein